MSKRSLHYNPNPDPSSFPATACGYENRSSELKNFQGEGFSWTSTIHRNDVTCDHCLFEIRLRDEAATIGDIHDVVKDTFMAEDEEFWARMKKIVREAIDEDEDENEAEYGRWHEERVMQSLDDFFTANLSAFKDLIKLAINENYLETLRPPKKTPRRLRNDAMERDALLSETFAPVMHYKLFGSKPVCDGVVLPKDDLSLSKNAVTCEKCLVELAKG